MVQPIKPFVPEAGREVRRAQGLPRLEVIERKSEVLKASSLGCLGRSYDATINLTQGCAHGCIYCYTRGYRNYPGDGRVLLYGNTVEKLKGELLRKRRLPETVYFSSSSDAFGPYRVLQRMTYEAMEVLLEHGIGISFLTKGYIWRRFYSLWRQYPGMVHGQVGINTLNPNIARWLEPMAAPPKRRLRNVKRLLECGIDATVRVDPLVPYVTDTPEQMTDLYRQLAGMGVKHLSAAYLFVRPRILRNILDDLPGPTLRRRLWEVYHAGVTVGLHGEGAAIRLPAAKYRAAGYERLRIISSRFGLTLRLCSCKNPDMDLADKCNLVTNMSADPVTRETRVREVGGLRGGRQLRLFEG
jgi:DNA repair photolyase